MRTRSTFAFLLSLAFTSPAAIAQCDGVWVQAANLPAPRRLAAAAYDSARGRLVVFGGVLLNGSLSNSTLEFDGTQWHVMSPTGQIPSARAGHAMAYDEARGVVVLVGGNTATGPVGGAFEYNGVSWTFSQAPGAPSARQNAAMAYDPVRQRIVLHGGQASSFVSSQTFEYDGTAWVQRTTSGPARHKHAMTYDPASGGVVLFGGQAESGPLPTGLWLWNGNTWEQRSGGTQPPARTHAGLTHASQRTVLFGGATSTGLIGGWWGLDPTGWTLHDPPGPVPRTEHIFAYHAGIDRIVLAGGQTATGVVSDTWLLQVPKGPTFTAPPQPQTVPPGQTAVFTAAASGSPTSWRWRRNGVLLEDDQRFQGCYSSTLIISGVLESDAGVYDVIAANPCGSSISPAATLTIGPACGTADFDGDGDVGTDADIEAFFACLSGNCCDACFPLGADFDADGDTGTDADIEAFFRVLAGGAC